MRWLRYLLTACLALTGTFAPSGPASAARCTVDCYRYWADITLEAFSNPTPVFPGGIHYVTVRAHNTGWRTGGDSPPRPWFGPTAGTVFVEFAPDSPQEYPEFYEPVPWPRVYLTALSAGTAPRNATCYGPGIPTGSYGECTVAFRAPFAPGFYTFTLWTASHFDEYDTTNNRISFTFEVRYLA
ncbi:hypothetical protein Daura_19325 [Dactylosporangium aurantiacum]|uniref:Secreted protein n=1 Tax=Dactylosporangium aurantiacum TaxID=35754 RepID=A0A9Q9IL25_9ACTN|nr:hypothetical protein [Dactylosporangium aurantiacum]MDG6110357.1 hypothetical protein [Dactylosporangium aurantiacum]UWZ58127.1 hypothetical protein Daura_19325 [Dactylosporangium aurantiacum]